MQEDWRSPPDPPGHAIDAVGQARNVRHVRTTMIVALGTSTPTSMTVVATRTHVLTIGKGLAWPHPWPCPSSGPCTSPTRSPKYCLRCAWRSSRRCQIKLVGAFHQRADPIGLRTIGEGTFEPLQNFLEGARLIRWTVLIGLRPAGFSRRYGHVPDRHNGSSAGFAELGWPS